MENWKRYLKENVSAQSLIAMGSRYYRKTSNKMDSETANQVLEFNGNFGGVGSEIVDEVVKLTIKKYMRKEVDDVIEILAGNRDKEGSMEYYKSVFENVLRSIEEFDGTQESFDVFGEQYEAVEHSLLYPEDPNEQIGIPNFIIQGKSGKSKLKIAGKWFEFHEIVEKTKELYLPGIAIEAVRSAPYDQSTKDMLMQKFGIEL